MRFTGGAQLTQSGKGGWQQHWLIEFVGIKRDENGNPTECKKKKGSKDVRIDALDGGKLFDPSNPKLPAALAIILNHLQDTIYEQAGKKVRECVLKSKD